jgi:thiamine biosynthesis lipoprotein
MSATLIALLAPALLASAAAPPPGLLLLSETRPQFGSLATVTVVTADPRLARVGIEAAFAQLDRVDWAMNEWRPDSPLTALNEAAGRGWTALPGDLCAALAAAKDGAERTGGRFDPTWAALSDLWRFDGTGKVPPGPVLRARCPLVNHRALLLRPRGSACEARLERAGMRVGLGGLAKGWAVDAAARALRALGIGDFLLQAGGDLYAGGSRGGEPWRVGIRDPRGDGSALASLDVSDRAFSTTADSEHFFVEGGRRYHHVIDPRTCAPAPGTRSVTVLARTAVDAEILGKAAFIAGGRGALDLARAWGAAVVEVTASGEVLASPEIAGRLAPPDLARPAMPPGVHLPATRRDVNPAAMPPRGAAAPPGGPLAPAGPTGPGSRGSGRRTPRRRAPRPRSAPRSRRGSRRTRSPPRSPRPPPGP